MQSQKQPQSQPRPKVKLPDGTTHEVDSGTTVDQARSKYKVSADAQAHVGGKQVPGSHRLQIGQMVEFRPPASRPRPV